MVTLGPLDELPPQARFTCRALAAGFSLEELARMGFVTRTLDRSASRLPDSRVHKHLERKQGSRAY